MTSQASNLGMWKDCSCNYSRLWHSAMSKTKFNIIIAHLLDAITPANATGCCLLRTVTVRSTRLKSTVIISGINTLAVKRKLCESKRNDQYKIIGIFYKKNVIAEIMRICDSDNIVKDCTSLILLYKLVAVFSHFFCQCIPPVTLMSCLGIVCRQEPCVIVYLKVEEWYQV